MENNLTQLLDLLKVKVVGLSIVEGITCFNIELNNSGSSVHFMNN